MADPNTDMSLADASSALEGLLARDENLGNDEPEKEEAAQAEETAESSETPAKVEEPDAEGEEAEAESEAEPEEEQTQEPLYTVKVDGKEQQVTLEELQRGYSGQKWISQRSQSMAAERKALEAEAAAVKQERAQYAEVLGKLASQLGSGEAEPDWEKLRAEDEFKFVVERQAWQLKQDRLNAVKAEQARIAGLQKQQQDEATQRYVEEENRKVLDKIPAWKDKTKAKAAISDLRDYAKGEGWTDEELDNARDSRAVLALYKAMQFDKLAKTQMPRPVAGRGPRSASPGAGSATPGRPAEVTRLKQRLAQTGSVDDAANIFLQQGVFE
jgi:hypothetical protein